MDTEFFFIGTWLNFPQLLRRIFYYFEFDFYSEALQWLNNDLTDISHTLQTNFSFSCSNSNYEYN